MKRDNPVSCRVGHGPRRLKEEPQDGRLAKQGCKTPEGVPKEKALNLNDSRLLFFLKIFTFWKRVNEYPNRYSFFYFLLSKARRNCYNVPNCDRGHIPFFEKTGYEYHILDL